MTIPRFVVKYYLNRVLDNFGIIVEFYPESYKRIWENISKRRINWKLKEHGNYFSQMNGYDWQLRINQHPKDPKYTLLIDREAVLSFNSLPDIWKFSK